MIFVCVAAAGCAGAGKSMPKDDQANAQLKRFLLLDSRVVATAENAHLVVGTVTKHKANPLFGEDKPWEKRFDNLYGSVIYDEDDGLYKLWYNPIIVDHSAKGMSLDERDRKHYRPPHNRELAICYATSRDGITWDKPELGLVDYEGSKKNNIVWRGPHGAGVFKDAREPDPRRRYKTIFAGIDVSVSADGLNWDEPQRCEGVDVAGDTHNNALWAPTLGKYVGITRTWGDDQREVARIESDDYVRWSKAEVVMRGLTKTLQPYAMPVFFHGGVYLGLVAIHDQKSDRVWTELAWSPDTKAWHRISPGTPLIPCSEVKLDYDYGCVYACAVPVFLKDEIRLYYGGSDYVHTGWRNGFLCLATLRPDGFAGYEPEDKDKPAVITTTPIAWPGGDIRISADVGQGGSVKVGVLDKDGNVIAEAKPISKTVTDKRLTLDKKIAADKVRLRFELTNAKLYSFTVSE